MSKSSNLKYLRIAGFGGLFVATSGIIFQYLIQQRLRKSDHHKLAVLSVLNHKKLCEHFGEPIAFGNVDLTSKDNYSTTSEAKYSVPLKGSQRRGMMHYEASRDPSDDRNRWRLEKVEVTDNGKPNERAIVPIRFASYEMIQDSELKSLFDQGTAQL